MPVVDYKNKLAQPIFGGELTYRANITSLSRDNADFDPITQTALITGQCDRARPPIRRVKTPDRTASCAAFPATIRAAPRRPPGGAR